MKITRATCALIIINISYVINAHLYFVEPPETTGKNVQLCGCTKRFVVLPQKGATLIIHSNQDDISDYIRDTQSPRVLLNIQENITHVKKNDWSYDMIIIIGETVDEIDQALRKLYGTPSWKPRGRYLVIYLGPGVEAMDRLFELAWEKYIVNIIVLCSINTNIYTYFPYRGGECGKNITAEVLGSCNDIALEALYPPKIPKRFNGCTIVVCSQLVAGFVKDRYSASDDAKIVGFEVALMNVIFQKLNVTRLEVTDNESRLANASGTIYDLIANRSEMSYGQNSIDKEYLDFDTSHVYNQDYMKWIVPIAQLGDQWKSIIIIFQDTLWYAVGCILIVNILIWWVVSKALNDGMTFTECVLGSWVVLLNGASKFPRTTAMRFLVVSWTVLCLLLITSYQSKLLALLLKPIYEPQIASEQDILDYNLDIPVPTYVVRYLNESTSETLRNIASRATIVSTAEYIHLWEIPNKNDAMLHFEHSMVFYFANFYKDKNGKYTRFIFKENVVNRVYFGAYFRKGHPLLNRFNDVLDRILDSGIMTKWMTDIYNIRIYAEDNTVHVPLNLNQLSSAFYLLGFGLVISFLIFIVEMMYYKYCQRKNNKY